MILQGKSPYMHSAKKRKKKKKNSLLMGIYLFYILAGYDCYNGPFLTSFDKFNLVILHNIIHNNAKEVYLNAFNSNPKHVQILFSMLFVQSILNIKTKIHFTDKIAFPISQHTV